MTVDIEKLITRLSGELDDTSLKVSEILAKRGNEQILHAMVDLLKHPNPDNRYIAAKTLEGIEQNEKALIPMWEAINDPENKEIKGDLLSALDGFDISDQYVDVFKLFLFGSFKVSRIAESLLDYKEFVITNRVIKKAKKHWSHYANNTKQDEAFTLQQAEVEERFQELSLYLTD